jgi:hypothetical protein
MLSTQTEQRAGGARQQLDPGQSLQIGDRLAQGGLAHVQFGRRLGHGAAIDCGDECIEVAQVEIIHIFQ